MHLLHTCRHVAPLRPMYLLHTCTMMQTCHSTKTNVSLTYMQSEIPLPSDIFFSRLAGAVGHQRALHTEKKLICCCHSVSTHFHVSWLSDFIFYPKPLYKSLRQSFFYSFITILPSESGVYTQLQHDFPLDPMISSFHIHFRTFVT